MQYGMLMIRHKIHSVLIPTHSYILPFRGLNAISIHLNFMFHSNCTPLTFHILTVLACLSLFIVSACLEHLTLLISSYTNNFLLIPDHLLIPTETHKSYSSDISSQIYLTFTFCNYNNHFFVVQPHTMQFVK